MSRAGMQRAAPWAVLGAAAAWLLFREWHYAGWMDDDAFISFRYARNLARGLGLVFNAGERVEGYTNFLWTVTLAAAARLGLEPPAAAQALGALLSLAALLVVTRIARVALAGTAAPVWCAWLPAVLLAVSESWAAWAVSGLENVAAAFLLLVAVLQFARAHEPGARPGALIAAAIFAGLAAMTHPAHALAALVLAKLLALQAWRGARPWGDAGRFVLVFALVFGTYFAWRWLYYGSLLPNTYHAKMGGAGLAVFARGFTDAGGIARAFPILVAAWAVALATRWRRARMATPAAQAATDAAIGIVAAGLAYAIAIGGDAFPAQRLFVTSLPFAAVLAARLVASAAAPAAARWRPATVAAVVVAGSAAAAYVAPDTRRLDAAIARDAVTMYRTAATWMHDHFEPGAVLAYSGAGVIAYYGDMPFIDTLGLTDAHIARVRVRDMGRGMAGHEKGDGRYVFGRKPDWIMFTGAPISSRSPQSRTDHELFAIREFHLQYELVRIPLRYTTRRGARPTAFDLYLFRRVAPE